jgi:hypothetical protein
MSTTPAQEIMKILNGELPSRFVYAPNYWQWFKHHQNHGIVPDEIRHCRTLTDVYKYLGEDIFSRNIYCDPEKYWFGGICKEVLDGFSLSESLDLNCRDRVITRLYSCDDGVLDENLTYVFNESTLVQRKFIFADYLRDFNLFRKFVAARKWEFRPEAFIAAQNEAGDDGVVVAGEFFSPLKMLHMAMGPVNAVYFLMDYPDKAAELLKLHEEAQLACIRDTVGNGVRVIMSMDNLDTMFHSPDYVEAYSASYYSRASQICHEYGAKFFIHACGQQKDNLRLIASYGVDGLEGVASPPLGDVWLDEAMEMTGDSFIITGGISAIETRDLITKDKIFAYVEQLFTKMLPHKNRFIFSASCNTAIDTTWETIKLFRDAWLEYKNI